MSRVDVKVVLLGKEYGGKTSLVQRYLYRRFEDIPYQNTIGAAYGARKIEQNGKRFMMGLWDTAGSERYESMSRMYYRGAWAAIICYDLTDADSFSKAQYWVSEVKENEESCRIFLCGTKKDLVMEDKSRRGVDYHTTTDYADEISSEVVETSAKTGDSVDVLFQKIADAYCTYLQEQAGTHGCNSSAVHLEEPRNRSNCCFSSRHSSAI